MGAYPILFLVLFHLRVVVDSLPMNIHVIGNESKQLLNETVQKKRGYGAKRSLHHFLSVPAHAVVCVLKAVFLFQLSRTAISHGFPVLKFVNS